MPPSPPLALCWPPAVETRVSGYGKVYTCTCTCTCTHIHVNESCRRKEERSKQGHTNNKANQHNTPKAVTFKMSCLRCTCTITCIYSMGEYEVLKRWLYSHSLGPRASPICTYMILCFNTDSHTYKHTHTHTRYIYIPPHVVLYMFLNER